MRADFVEAEIDGKKGYQDKDSAELRKHLFNVKGENKSYKEKFTELENSKAAAIEKARADALEEAKTKGDVAEIEKRYQEQMKDLAARSKEEGKNEATKEFKLTQAKEKAKSLALRLAADIAVDKDSRETLEELLEKFVTVDPETGKEIYLNSDGTASSLGYDAFKAELAKQPRYARLVKAELATSGGGQANGGAGGGAGANTKTNEKAEKAKKAGDVTSFIQASLNPTR
jgi:hypothetical protein